MNSQSASGLVVGTNRHRCTICQREFKRAEHLRRHAKSHTQERPFGCACGAQFGRKDLLRRHERIVHGSSKDAPRTSRSRVTDHPDQPVPEARAARQATGENETLPGPSLSSNQYRNLHGTLPTDATTSDKYPTPNSGITEPEQLSGGNGSRSGENAHLSGDDIFDITAPSASMDFQSLFRPFKQPSNSYSSTPDVPSAGQGTIGNRAIEKTLPTIFPMPFMPLGGQIVPHYSHPVITEPQRGRILRSLGGFDTLVSDFNLPSCDALTRFLAGYFSGFYSHAPFAHAPTFKVEGCSPELLLSMVAIGAVYRYESHTATRLFYMAKAMFLEGQRQKGRNAIKRLGNQNSSDYMARRDIIQEIHCLLCLVTFATWQKDPDLKNESIMLQSLLAHSTRMSGLEDVSPGVDNLDWETWAQEESERRTKLFAFCFLNIQSLAYDLPPVLLSDEMRLKLPCSCPEWTAPDATSWALLRQSTRNEQDRFDTTLENLLSLGLHDHHDRSSLLSPTANYVLLHGLLQKIVWSNRMFPINVSSDSSGNHKTIFVNALRKWTTAWQRTPESNLEPMDPNGPLPFTSTTLLSLAYIRNCSNFGSARALISWDPVQIATSLRSVPPLNRNRNVLLAALHSTHVLSTLVKLGVEYIRNTQAFTWSIEDALCGLECAIFLNKWILGIGETIHKRPLSEDELNLLEWIGDVLQEGLVSVKSDNIEPISSSEYWTFSFQVVKVWSHIMQGSSPWSFIRMIGEALTIYGNDDAHSY